MLQLQILFIAFHTIPTCAVIIVLVTVLLFRIILGIIINLLQNPLALPRVSPDELKRLLFQSSFHLTRA